MCLSTTFQGPGAVRGRYVPDFYAVVKGEAETPPFSYASDIDDQSQDPIFVVGQRR